MEFDLIFASVFYTLSQVDYFVGCKFTLYEHLKFNQPAVHVVLLSEYCIKDILITRIKQFGYWSASLFSRVKISTKSAYFVEYGKF